MKSYPGKFECFQRKIVSEMEALKKLQIPYKESINLWPVYPIHTNSCIIWRAIILPFSSSKYSYSWLRLSNLFNLSFEYRSFSNKWKTTILFPSIFSRFCNVLWEVFGFQYELAGRCYVYITVIADVIAWLAISIRSLQEKIYRLNWTYSTGTRIINNIISKCFYL